MPIRRSQNTQTMNTNNENQKRKYRFAVSCHKYIYKNFIVQLDKQRKSFRIHEVMKHY